MFGKNDVMGPRHDAQTFLVKSIFPTIQGEGPFAGQTALFLRLGGCNLRCYFCDTDFSSDLREVGSRELVAALTIQLTQVNTDLLVVTGGEPMLQNIALLVKTVWAELPQIKRIQIETAGTVWPKGLEHCNGPFVDPSVDGSVKQVFIVVSPKTSTVHPMIRKHADAWKYIVNAGNTAAGDGLPVTTTQSVLATQCVLARPSASKQPVVYVQPMDEQNEEKNRANMQAATDICFKHGYRLSLQLHKILGVE